VILSGSGILISLMVLLLAVLVSQSRLLMKIHSPREVLLGAVLGATITLITNLLFE